MFADRKIKVLVVDDSVIVRRLLTDQLGKDSGIEVVGTAVDPYVARDKILELNPDVLTLDIEMPRMDGLTFLKILMKHHPMPIIIFSSLSQKGSAAAMQALQSGAVDVLGKPDGSSSVGHMGTQLIEKVKAAARAKVRNLPQAPAPIATRAAAARTTAPAPSLIPGRPAGTPQWHPRQLLLLGASTGGTEALREVLVRMPREVPGICIVQHIPPYFSKAFADRLNSLCDLDVREAIDGDVVEPGLALVAPGDYHMVLHWIGQRYRVSLTKTEPVWHQRPAVDVLFSSAVEAGAAPYAVGGLFTGMGKDGAEGLLKLRQKGSITYAQNEETCVVFGMPRAAMELGAAEQMLPLGDFPQALMNAAVRQARKAAPSGGA
ncbi:two-component system, chemotaxis family, response regulator CheB [Verrucomicrobium sp. GAS474]|uniref:protein-glutamate methylesterase/protein-glutamine glutaminase n=1 Tax=Verrucomicrobium sp. GAS474 TaxID=1882831 RepID=UPI00087C6199|nr:chemotaxis response regulator protein-glutamate methylesterase [Verrucomicrobium sp. GAS474]SDT85729.1 two-component system, chemotaxis family, response regulator CheB [Verrucomicrobium sp. GAS474]